MTYNVGSQVIQNHYAFVFLNACLTADRKTGTAAEGFLKAFKADAYVGWKGSRVDLNNVGDGEIFLAYLARKDATVSIAVNNTNTNPGVPRNDKLLDASGNVADSDLDFLGNGERKILIKAFTPPLQ